MSSSKVGNCCDEVLMKVPRYIIRNLFNDLSKR